MSLLFLVALIVGGFWLLVTIIASFQFAGMILQYASMNGASPFWHTGNPFAWIAVFIAVGVVFCLVKIVMGFFWKVVLSPFRDFIMKAWERSGYSMQAITWMVGGVGLVLAAAGLFLSYVLAGIFLGWAETTGATEYFRVDNFWAWAVTVLTIFGLLLPSTKRSAV